MFIMVHFITTLTHNSVISFQIQKGVATGIQIVVEEQYGDIPAYYRETQIIDYLQRRVIRLHTVFQEFAALYILLCTVHTMTSVSLTVVVALSLRIGHNLDGNRNQNIWLMKLSQHPAALDPVNKIKHVLHTQPFLAAKIHTYTKLWVLYTTHTYASCMCLELGLCVCPNFYDHLNGYERDDMPIKLY